MGIFSQNPDKQVEFGEDPLDFPRWQVIEATVMVGDAYNHVPLSLLNRISIFLRYLLVIGYPHQLYAMSILALLMLGSALLTAHWVHTRRIKRASDHCAVKAAESCSEVVPCVPPQARDVAVD